MSAAHPSQRLFAELTVIGKDKKGIVSEITSYLFSNHGNIEQINQNVAHGLFMMHLQVSFSLLKFQKTLFEEGLFKAAKKLDMEIKLHYESNQKKRMAILVTKEPHCLEVLLEAWKKKKLSVDIPLVIGSSSQLAPFVKKYSIPFKEVNQQDVKEREAEMLSLLGKADVDFILLARYMKILSPYFVWRYPNRIINIHPSILPAFPGAHAYTQAFERGVKIIGCSAHFVTSDLDQGPIIWQEAFQVTSKDTLASIRIKGKKLEEKVLLKAAQLYLKNKLEVYWGKVALKP